MRSAGAAASTTPAGAKDKYRALCAKEPSIPLFARDWWLDATAGENAWNVAIVEKGNHIAASLPYLYRNKFGFRVVSQPPLTPSLGPWLAQPNKQGVSLSHQKEMMAALIAQLPRFDHFAQSWHYRNSNWLPFYWQGFHQTTRYTYVLKDISDPDKLMAGFQHHVRSEINKAQTRFKLAVRDDLPVDALYALNRLTFQRQGKQPPYSAEYVRRIDAACARNGGRSKVFVAEDAEGRHHAAVYVVWDESSAYYLMGGGDPELRTSGASTLCMWRAIQYAAGVTKQFDFEGSMLEPVERFFRDFGGVQMPYFHISKTPSRILRARESILSVLGRS